MDIVALNGHTGYSGLKQVTLMLNRVLKMILSNRLRGRQNHFDGSIPNIHALTAT